MSRKTTDKPVKKPRIIRKGCAKYIPVVEYAEYAGTLSEIVESKDISKNQYIGDTLSGTAYKSYFRVNL